MMSGEASVGPCASLTKPVIMEASRTKKQSPGIHRSRKALFMSMLAPFSVVLNLMVPPQMEFTARHSAFTYVHLRARSGIHPCMDAACNRSANSKKKKGVDRFHAMPCNAQQGDACKHPAAGLQMTPTEHVRMSCRYWDGQGPAVHHMSWLATLANHSASMWYRERT